jgi:hemolysin III
LGEVFKASPFLFAGGSFRRAGPVSLTAVRELDQDDHMDREEKFNSISHLIGATLALAGLVVLVVSASMKGDPWRIVSFSIYGATLFALYLFSTLYHSLRGKSKALFQKIDHTAIYLLIAGTYTPFTLVTMKGTWGWTIFSIVWGLAVAGIVQELALKTKHRILSVVIYLVMGWVVVIAIRPLMKVLPVSGMVWLVAGGVFYTIGVIFYVLDKKILHGHGIFHVFVLAGSISHYIAILWYVA